VAAQYLVSITLAQVAANSLLYLVIRPLHPLELHPISKDQYRFQVAQSEVSHTTSVLHQSPAELIVSASLLSPPLFVTQEATEGSIWAVVVLATTKARCWVR
jgi:hypothetical protein